MPSRLQQEVKRGEPHICEGILDFIFTTLPPSPLLAKNPIINFPVVFMASHEQSKWIEESSQKITIINPDTVEGDVWVNDYLAWPLKGPEGYDWSTFKPAFTVGYRVAMGEGSQYKTALWVEDTQSGFQKKIEELPGYIKNVWYPRPPTSIEDASENIRTQIPKPDTFPPIEQVALVYYGLPTALVEVGYTQNGEELIQFKHPAVLPPLRAIQTLQSHFLERNVDYIETLRRPEQRTLNFLRWERLKEYHSGFIHFAGSVGGVESDLEYLDILLRLDHVQYNALRIEKYEGVIRELRNIKMAEQFRALEPKPGPLSADEFNLLKEEWKKYIPFFKERITLLYTKNAVNALAEIGRTVLSIEERTNEINKKRQRKEDKQTLLSQAGEIFRSEGIATDEPKGPPYESGIGRMLPLRIRKAIAALWREEQSVKPSERYYTPLRLQMLLAAGDETIGCKPGELFTISTSTIKRVVLAYSLEQEDTSQEKEAKPNQVTLVIDVPSRTRTIPLQIAELLSVDPRSSAVVLSNTMQSKDSWNDRDTMEWIQKQIEIVEQTNAAINVIIVDDVFPPHVRTAISRLLSEAKSRWNALILEIGMENKSRYEFTDWKSDYGALSRISALLARAPAIQSERRKALELLFIPEYREAQLADPNFSYIDKATEKRDRYRSWLRAVRHKSFPDLAKRLGKDPEAFKEELRRDLDTSRDLLHNIWSTYYYWVDHDDDQATNMLHRLKKNIGQTQEIVRAGDEKEVKSEQLFAEPGIAVEAEHLETIRLNFHSPIEVGRHVGYVLYTLKDRFARTQGRSIELPVTLPTSNTMNFFFEEWGRNISLFYDAPTDLELQIPQPKGMTIDGIQVEMPVSMFVKKLAVTMRDYIENQYKPRVLEEKKRERERFPRGRGEVYLFDRELAGLDYIVENSEGLLVNLELKKVADQYTINSLEGKNY